jgi:hypothetical protein
MMSDPFVVVHGSDDDVDALEKALAEAGVKTERRYLVKASENAKIAAAIVVPVVNKRLVERHGDKTILKGYSASEAEQLLKIWNEVTIQDDE